jgi:uncharacterized protein
MRKNTVFMGFLTIMLLTSALGVYALEVPPLKGRINDRAGVLSSSESRDLENYLAGVEKATGAQIALLTIPSLEGESLESYSFRVADSWQLGSADKDNGALLLIAMEEKKIRIEVGYGLEAVLTDAMSGYIIREAIVPEFKKGEFDRGIAAGLKSMGGVVTGDTPISVEQINESQQQESEGGVSIFFLIFIFVFFFGRIGRYRRYRRRGMSPMGAFFLGSMLGGASRGGSSSGGFGGGGFSGGGGGFGGGGASGGW